MPAADVRIGCCGFPVARAKYFKSFSVVEVNQTFYKYPRPQLMEKWRALSPEGFEYTVKANKEITHIHAMKPGREVGEALSKMSDICLRLSAKILLLQTPASFKPTATSLKNLGRTLSRVRQLGLQPVYEPRGPAWEEQEARRGLNALLEEAETPHVVDPLKSEPVHATKIAYFRLHGLGKRLYRYDYSGEELKRLKEKIDSYPSERVYVFFNNIPMFKNASQFAKLYDQKERS